MKFDKDIETINETISAINNLELENEHPIDHERKASENNAIIQKAPDKEKLLKKKLAKQVHPWLWQLISITLGVDPQRRENPGVVSCILELLTVGSALGNNFYLIFSLFFSRCYLMTISFKFALKFNSYDWYSSMV